MRPKTRPDTSRTLRIRAQEAARQRRHRGRRKLREAEERRAAAAEMERQAEAIHRRQNGWMLLRLLRPMRVTFEGGLGFIDLEPGAQFWVRESVAHEWLRRGDAEPLSMGEVILLGARIVKRPDTFQSPEWEPLKERLPSGY